MSFCHSVCVCACVGACVHTSMCACACVCVFHNVLFCVLMNLRAVFYSVSSLSFLYLQSSLCLVFFDFFHPNCIFIPSFSTSSAPICPSSSFAFAFHSLYGLQSPFHMIRLLLQRQNAHFSYLIMSVVHYSDISLQVFTVCT